ncbi:MAG TPA: ribosomal L7Ae/L30e/S12e/Gadd45 family protein [Candidatus Limivivens intestinipullorum]|uniref:Ribosomal L7Ae/L30e/S12e/Gadd45 family protein n=1 Tax=Candidatus Limivivens intestinipullorum TaxID=2840858 RepID=A0A9D1EUY2_9FIRM|nr:ribosomal L7Ae/L30e/S12e/Gadd45 family protein [Candidatus Limivivens intestinipullorum]
MNLNKVLSLVGLATRAGRTAAGEYSTEKAVKEGRAFLVIVSEESSANTKKKFQNMCAYYKVPICFYGTKEELGAANGKQFRASAAVLDEGFAKRILKELGEDGNGGNQHSERERSKSDEPYEYDR